MAQTLKGLSKRMRERAKSIPELGNELAKAGTLAMLEEMIEVTPVDSTEALSNWQVNLGNPAADELEPYVRGQKGSTRGASADKTLAEGRTELQYKKPGQPIFLSNLAGHIADLDKGSSTQFPGGFVPRALIAFRMGVELAKKRLLR